LKTSKCWVWFKGSLNNGGYWKEGFTCTFDENPGVLIESPAYVTCRVPSWRVLTKEPENLYKSPLIPDKASLGFRFPCDGPGRGGTCQVSSWDHVFLALFWMYNCLSIVIFHFSWKMQSDVWGLTGGNFAQSSITINGWLRDFLWAQASQVLTSYGNQ